MAKAKTAIVVIVILFLLQVSWTTAHKKKKKHKHEHNHDHDHKNGGGSGAGTHAVMTVNGFEKGQDGGGPSECDGKFHSNDDLIVALSTRWYAGGNRCHNHIRITSKDTGRTVEATVVDECDSGHGCRNNIVDASAAVWKKLGLDTNVGEVHVTWSDA